MMAQHRKKRNGGLGLGFNIATLVEMGAFFEDRERESVCQLIIYSVRPTHEFCPSCCLFGQCSVV